MTNANPIVSMTVVAVGPGDPRMLTLRGRQAIEEADLVIGFKTVLDVVDQWATKGEVRPMAYRDQEEVLEYAQSQASQGKKCVVCCWGDLNVSANELLERVYRRADRVELIPGVSSIQVACARAGISLEQSLFVTLHNRADPDLVLEEVTHYLQEGRRNIILLPRPYDLMPAGIAASLIEAGIPADRTVTVFQRLTLEGEKQWSGTLEQCAAITEEFSDLSILVFPRPVSEPD
ncbi:MAG: precorrin-6y C5,15-methyltransferase (decarboxylating) subunit CbiE [Dehalococcoidia bacterium]